MQPIEWTSSKKEMYQAYKEILKKYEDLINNPSPASQKTRETERKEAILQKVSQHTPESLIESIAHMKVSIAKTLDGLSETLAEEAKNLHDLKQAKEIAYVELEKMTDAKLAAEAIEIWLGEHEKQKKVLELDLSDKKLNLESEIEEIRSSWISEQKERQKNYKEEETERKKNRDREEQDYQYNLNMIRKKDDDERKEKLASFERNITSKRQSLEDEITRNKQDFEREKNEIDTLREKAKHWPLLLEEAKNTTKSEISKELTAKHEHDLSILRQKFESASEIAEIRIKALTDYVAKQETRIEELSKKLELETTRVHEIANKAVEGASGANAFTAVNRIALEQAKRQIQGASEEQRR